MKTLEQVGNECFIANESSERARRDDNKIARTIDKTDATRVLVTEKHPGPEAVAVASRKRDPMNDCAHKEKAE